MSESIYIKILAYLRQHKEAITFLVGGALMFLALLAGIVESGISNSFFKRMGEANIQKDFLELVTAPTIQEGGIPVAEVTLDEQNNIVVWKGNNYLPDKEDLKKTLPNLKEGYHEFSMMSYYVVPFPDQRKYRLIPLRIKYGVVSVNLPEYNFAGRYGMKANQIQKLVSVSVSNQKPSEKDLEHSLTIRRNGVPVFFITQFNEDILRLPFRFWFFFFGLVGLLLFLVGGFYYMRNQLTFKSRTCNLLLLSAILLLRLIMSYFNFPYEYSKLYLFSAETLAFHWLVPSLGDLLVNIMIFNLSAYILYKELLRYLLVYIFKATQGTPFLQRLIIIVNQVIVVWMIFVFIDVTQQILSNSQLKIDFSNILEFSRNVYAQVLLGGIGLLLLGVYFLSIPFLRFNIHFIEYRKNKLFYFLIQLIIVAFIVLYFREDDLINAFSIFTAIAFWMITIYLMPNKKLMEYDLVNYIFLIGSFSALLCTLIVSFNFQKKVQTVESFAEKTFSEQDNKIYQSYDQAFFQMDQDVEEIRMKCKEMDEDWDAFAEFFEKQYFKKYIKGVELKVFIFRPIGERLVTKQEKKGATKNRATGLISEEESLGEEIENTFYKGVTKNNEEVYIGTPALILENNDTLLLRVQIYPSKLKLNGVYPYFLQNNENIQFSEMLKEFDVALYKNDVLVSNSGKSIFPIRVQTKIKDSVIGKQTLDGQNGKIDFILAFGGNRAVAIRYDSVSWVDYTNTLSLIFFFLSIGTLIVFMVIFFLSWIFISKMPLNIYTFQFRFQFLLLGLSVFILASVSVFLQFTIKERFLIENQNNLHDEMNAIKNTVIDGAEGLTDSKKDSAISPIKALEMNLIRDITKKQSLDVNIFDKNGEMVICTQNLLKDYKLISGLMDYNAYQILNIDGLSEAFIKEKNANIEFLSAFKTVTIDNNKGNLRLPDSAELTSTLYVNVPYFDRTEEVNRKTTNLLGFIISIVMLFVIFIALITIYISRYLTSPLKELQNKISTTKFGISNEPMEYAGKDEIGAIVSSYNSMLNKLKESETQLAQSERDLAWRQMAKQVAHEIKNPLTPIKLSVQHLTKAWAEKHPNIDKMFQKVTQTILSQIETLTRIADNFSEFARMPEAHRQNIVLNEILTEVVTLFTHQDENVILSIKLPEDNFVIFADKDHISRAFINLCKNAIQAIDNKENKNGMVQITLDIINNKGVVTLKDNGCGMTEEVQNRAFEPNFSTKSSGMGLGLAMVKRIIELSQGEIRLDSIEGEGTTFYIVFPRSTEVA